MNIPKTKIEIPNGFRALREDEIITSSDLYSISWVPVVKSVGRTPQRMNTSRRLTGKNEAVYIRAVEPATVKPTIPAGYRLLGVGEVIAEGDKVWEHIGGWAQARCTVGHEIYPRDVSWFFCIRAVETPSDVQRCGSTGKIIIPSGWRRLDRNEFRQTGDRFTCCGEWVKTNVPGGLVGKGASGPYIRREAPKVEPAPAPVKRPLPAENLWDGKPVKFYPDGQVITPRGWRRLYPHERVKKEDFFTGSAKRWLAASGDGYFVTSDRLAYFRLIS